VGPALSSSGGGQGDAPSLSSSVGGAPLPSGVGALSGVQLTSAAVSTSSLPATAWHSENVSVSDIILDSIRVFQKGGSEVSVVKAS
jgi:hypothetical protein